MNDQPQPQQLPVVLPVNLEEAPLDVTRGKQDIPRYLAKRLAEYEIIPSVDLARHLEILEVREFNNKDGIGNSTYVLLHYKTPEQNLFPAFPACRGTFVDITNMVEFPNYYPFTPSLTVATSLIGQIKSLNLPGVASTDFGLIFPSLYKNQPTIKFKLGETLQEAKGTDIIYESSIGTFINEEKYEYLKTLKGPQIQSLAKIYFSNKGIPFPEELLKPQSSSSSQTPSESQSSSDVPVDDGYKRVIKNTFACEMKALLSGTIIRIYKFNGQVFFSTHRKMDAKESKWNSDSTFYELYKEAGGPPIESLFPLEVEYAPNFLVFMLMYKGNNTENFVIMNKPHLFYLGNFSKYYDMELFRINAPTIDIKKLPFDLDEANPDGKIFNLLPMDIGTADEEFNLPRYRVLDERKNGMKVIDSIAELQPTNGVIITNVETIKLIKYEKSEYDKAKLQFDNNNVLELAAIKSQGGENNVAYNNLKNIVKLKSIAMTRRDYLRMKEKDPYRSYLSLVQKYIPFLVTNANDFIGSKNAYEILDKVMDGSLKLDMNTPNFLIINAIMAFNKLFYVPSDMINMVYRNKVARRTITIKKKDAIAADISNDRYIKPFSAFYYGVYEILLVIKETVPLADQRIARMNTLSYIVYYNLLQSIPPALQGDNVDMFTKLKDSVQSATKNLMEAESISKKFTATDFVDETTKQNKAETLANRANYILDKSREAAINAVPKISHSHKKNLKEFPALKSDQKAIVIRDEYLPIMYNDILNKLGCYPLKNYGLLKRLV
jgi:hypothetical protein